jgi:hypothetical protein
MRASYTQGIAGVCAFTSKTLVNSRSNKVVNIASTKMMRVKFWFKSMSAGFFATLNQFHRHGRARPGHPRLFFCERRKPWMPGTSPGMTAILIVSVKQSS